MLPQIQNLIAFGILTCELVTFGVLIVSLPLSTCQRGICPGNVVDCGIMAGLTSCGPIGSLAVHLASGAVQGDRRVSYVQLVLLATDSLC